MSINLRQSENNVVRNKSPQLTKLILTNWNLNESYDLRNIFTSLNIYSSIDGILTSGDITVSEQGNLISQCPIDGREFIEIEFCSLEGQYESFHRLFFVYAVDSLEESNDTRVYCIRFTDVFAVLNPDLRLSIKYEDKIENIIKQIEKIFENPESGNEEFKQILKNHNNIPTKESLFPFKTNNELSVETDYNMKFIVPLWKPLQVIDYLVDRALSKDSVSLQEDRFTDCVFFQNRKGEFVLTNYKKMFNTRLSTKYNKEITFKKVIANIDTKETTTRNNSGLSEVKYAVQKYSLTNVFNNQAQKLAGFFGFTDYITDFANAKCEPKTVLDEEIQSCIKRYGISIKRQYPYQTIRKSENPVFYYDVCGMNTGIDENEYQKFTLPYLKGKVIKQYLEHAKIIIEMNGVSDIDIGKYVYIDLGKAEGNNSITQYVNDTKWIVSKYSHRFLPDGTFTTIVECFTPYINREHDVNQTNTEQTVQRGNDMAVNVISSMITF